MAARPESLRDRVVPFPGRRQTDAELVQAVVRGDHDALGAVWDRYVGEVRAMIRERLGSDSASDDLVQEVFIAFYQSAARLENPRALRSYLLGIALRQTALELRGRYRRWRRLRITKTGDLPEVPAAEAAVEPRDALRVLQRVLQRVPELPRMAFVLRYAHDLSPVEVAIVLRISQSKARRAITRGRARVLSLARQEPALLSYLRPYQEDR